ncbi:MAG: hypothetical protein RBT63_05295 [Bdellovibrionales bacterium]|nr:hypothetical protein [Bdellovibrionales bacterium]
MQKRVSFLVMALVLFGSAALAQSSRSGRVSVDDLPNRAKFDSTSHSLRTDETTGLSIGADLYQAKVDELGNIIRASGGDAKAIEKAVIRRNEGLIQRMQGLKFPVVPRNRVNALNRKQLRATLQSIEATPANDARNDMKMQYDPDGAFGFCFGRAYFFANEAGLRGLVKDSIKKVFLIGKMQLKTPILGVPLPIGVWQFHVATAVRGVDGAWYVLDNHYDRSLKKVPTVTEWYEFYRKHLDSVVDYDIKMADGGVEQASAKALFLYFTDPDKIGASSMGYNVEGFYGTDINGDGYIDRSNEAFYNSYFIDLDQYFDDMVKHLSLCSPVRYAPMSESSALCQRPEEKAKVDSWQAYLKRLKRLLEEEKDREFFERFGGSGS